MHLRAIYRMVTESALIIVCFRYLVQTTCVLGWWQVTPTQATTTLTADTQLSMMIHLFSCPSCTVVFWWRMLKLDMPFSCYCTCLSCIIVFWWWITADIWATHIRKHQLKDAKVIFANRQHLCHFCICICLAIVHELVYHCVLVVNYRWYMSHKLENISWRMVIDHWSNNHQHLCHFLYLSCNCTCLSWCIIVVLWWWIRADIWATL